MPKISVQIELFSEGKELQLFIHKVINQCLKKTLNIKTLKHSFSVIILYKMHLILICIFINVERASLTIQCTKKNVTMYESRQSPKIILK